jgi:glycosyltransferase involved in cell wall biosynthesis
MFDPGIMQYVPRVSVITAAFNAEKTIKETVDSIRCQTLKDWEHIVVDDGSTDNTLKMLHQFEREDPRFRVVHQKNAKQAAARNTALPLAKAEFIAIIDADDQAIPERLEKQVRFLEENKKIDVLGSWANDIQSSTGKPLGIQYRRETHDDLVRNIYKECPFITSTVIARRAFFLKMGGFRPHLTSAEDYDLWLRGYRFGRYHNLQEPLVMYSCRDGMSWKSAFTSARVILGAANRDKQLFSHSGYALRPIAYAAFSKTKREVVSIFRTVS